ALRVRDEDERTWRRVNLLAVHGEERVALQHEVQLLVPGRLLTVLSDDGLALVGTEPGIDAERAHPEVVADRHPAVARLDVGDPGKAPAAHKASRSGARSSSSRARSSRTGWSSSARRRCGSASSGRPARHSMQATR